MFDESITVSRRLHLAARRGPAKAALLLLLVVALCSLAATTTRAFDLNLLPEEQSEELAKLEAAAAAYGPDPTVDAERQQQQERRHSNRRSKAKTDWRDEPGSSSGNGPARGSSIMGWMGRIASKTGSAISSTMSQLPQYFNFDQFARQFRRRYSAAEALFRKSMFLRRCMEVFRGRVDYRLGRKSYLQNVNKFSDRSPNEFRRMFMSGPPMELKPEGQSEEEYYRELRRVDSERSTWDAELASRASLDDDSDGDGDEGAPGQVTILHELQAKRQIELMIMSGQVGEAEHMAMLEELRGAHLDTFSQAAADDGDKRPLPWPGTREAPPELLERKFKRRPYAAPELGADEGLDWSEHQCFHKVYDQGTKCGKCYVMAATALAEFYKCSERQNVIDRRQFSKDYVMDCGQKFAPTILGCTGGSLLDTLKFIAEAGLHNIKGWRQLRQVRAKELAEQGALAGPLDQRCPFNRMETPVQSWGSIRLEMVPVQVDANEWLEALEDGPLAVSVQMPAEGLEGYAGGVHDGAGCADSGHWHSMVLVGYGTNERGIAYWRFRNSWGADWGDNGHFNMAMDVPGECLAGGVRLYRAPASS